MKKPVDEGLGHALVVKEITTFREFHVRGDDGRFLGIALIHEPEEDIGLFRPEVEITKFVDEQEIEAGELIEQFSRGFVGEAGVHFVEKVLSLDEEAPVAVSDGDLGKRNSLLRSHAI